MSYRRRHRGHPVVFAMSGLLLMGAVSAGAWLAVALLAAVMVWLLVRA